MTKTKTRLPRRRARAQLVLREEQLSRWRKAAFAADRTLSDFIRVAVDQYVEQLEAAG